MIEVRRTKVDTPALGTQRRGGMMGAYREHLERFAERKFLINENSRVVEVLREAGRQVMSSPDGRYFMSLSLSGSHVMDMAGKGSDVDYYVTISRDAPDPMQTKEAIKGRINGVLAAHGFRPDGVEYQKIFIVPHDFDDPALEMDPYLPGELVVHLFASMFIAGDAGRAQSECLKQVLFERACSDRHPDIFPDFSLDSLVDNCRVSYGNMLWLHPGGNGHAGLFLHRFMKNRLELFLPPLSVDHLRKDVNFVGEMRLIAEPYIKERIAQFPFPEDIVRQALGVKA